MPIRWLLREEAGHIAFEAWGEVTMDEILAAGRDVAAKVQCRLRTVLADYSDVTVLATDADGIHRLLEQDRALSPIWDGSRCAVVASQDHIYGMARMYVELSSGTPGTVRVFRDRAEAVAWMHESPDDD